MSPHANTQGRPRRDRDVSPGIHVDQLGIAGNVRLGFGGFGKGEDLVVFRVHAVGCALRARDRLDVVTRPVDERLAYLPVHVAIDLRPQQYRFELGQGFVAGADVETPQGLFQRRGRDGVGKEGGADQ